MRPTLICKHSPSFAGTNIIHHAGEGTVYVAITWLLDEDIEFWCKEMEPQGLPSGLSLAAEVYFAGLHFKLFGYVSEGKFLSQRSDTTGFCSGTARLGY